MANTGRTPRVVTIRAQDVAVEPSMSQFPYLNTGPDAKMFKGVCSKYCIDNQMRSINDEVIAYAIDHLEFNIDFWKQPRRLCAFYPHNASERCPAGPWTPEFYAAVKSEDSAKIDELKRQLRAERDERILKKQPTVFSSGNVATKRKSVEEEDLAPSAGKKAASAKRRKSKSVVDSIMEIPDSLDFDEPASADKQKPKERVRYLKAVQADFDRFDKANSLFIAYRSDEQIPVFCMIPNDHPDLSDISDDLQQLDWIEYEAVFSALKNNVFKDGEAKESWEMVRTMFTTDGLAINTFYASDVRYNAAFKDDELCPASAQEFQVMPEMVRARIDRTAAFFRDSEPDSGKGDALEKFWEYFISSQCMRDYERHLDQMPIYDSLHDKLMTDMTKNFFPTEDDMDQIEVDARVLIEYGRMSESIYQIVLSNMRRKVEDNAGLEDGTLCREEEMRQCLEKFVEYETRFTNDMMDDYLNRRRTLIELTKKMEDDDFILTYEEVNNETLRTTLNDIPGVWQSVAAAYEPVRKAAQARMTEKGKRDELEAQKNQATAELKEQKQQADDLRRQLAALQQQLDAAGGKAADSSSDDEDAQAPDPAPPAALPGKKPKESRPSGAIDLVSAAPSRRGSLPASRRESRAASPDPQDLMVDGPRERKQNSRYKPGRD